MPRPGPSRFAAGATGRKSRRRPQRPGPTKEGSTEDVSPSAQRAGRRLRGRGLSSRGTYCFSFVVVLVDVAAGAMPIAAIEIVSDRHIRPDGMRSRGLRAGQEFVAELFGVVRRPYERAARDKEEPHLLA